jgi:hypothetical protein
MMQAVVVGAASTMTLPMGTAVATTTRQRVPARGTGIILTNTLHLIVVLVNEYVNKMY